jgi:thiamine-phosphate pyrophosphorylase
MIVVSNPIAVTNEINIIHSLFENGLELLHVRKPNFSEEEMKAFLSEIKTDFRQQLVLHSHHQLASSFGINRIQKPFRVLNSDRVKKFERVKKKEIIFSTSAHSIEEFNSLPDVYDYAFLSPVFKSISKENYHSKTNLLEDIKKRTNFKTKLIALGGISSVNIKIILEKGFDDIALLGTIWNSNNPIENFKLCQQIVLSY